MFDVTFLMLDKAGKQRVVTLSPTGRHWEQVYPGQEVSFACQKVSFGVVFDVNRPRPRRGYAFAIT
jgi:hypothetical protein